VNRLEKIPFKFLYRFTCDDEGCSGHTFRVLDWEVGAAYRKFLRSYGDDWEVKIQDKFWRYMIEKTDLQFFVGTIKNNPHTWSIIGLYYPGIGRIPVSPQVAHLKLPGFE
jgi:hypothetical protein